MHWLGGGHHKGWGRGLGIYVEHPRSIPVSLTLVDCVTELGGQVTIDYFLSLVLNNVL